MTYSYCIKANVISHIGYSRKNHEDNFLLDSNKFITVNQQSRINLSSNFNSICEIDKCISTKGIYSVSDGMGGHQAGEVASLTAVIKLSEARDYILSASSLQEVVNHYQENLMHTNASIIKKSSNDNSLRGMGATLTTLIIYDGHAIGINLGDSRMYQFRHNHLTQMTKDHTEGQRMLDLNLLTPEELKRFKPRKELTRYLGMGDEFLIVKGEPTKIIEIDEKCWFLLCTDGLTDMVDDSVIQEILSKYFPQENKKMAVEELVAKALEGSNGKRGGLDNITAMIVEVSPDDFDN